MTNWDRQLDDPNPPEDVVYTCPDCGEKLMETEVEPAVCACERGEM